MDKDEAIQLYDMTDYYIGLGLALSSSGFIGLYFILFIIFKIFKIIQYYQNYIKRYIVGIYNGMLNLTICFIIHLE